MNNKSKSGVKGIQYKHEQVRFDQAESHRRPSDCDIYERYSVPYHNEGFHDRYERNHERQQFRERRSPDDRYESVTVPHGIHVARIEIANDEEESWNQREVERDPMKTKSYSNNERRGTGQQNSNSVQNTSNIPPPPCMKKFEVIDGYRSSLNQIASKQQQQANLVKGSGPKRRTRDEQPQYNSDPLIERPRYPDSKTSPGAKEHISLSKEKPNKMVVVNMAKTQNGGVQRPADAKSPANRRVSTNPFLKVPDNKHQHREQTTPQQHIKNVQEVVQKMNSGEWPIKVNEEIVEVKIEVPPLQKKVAQREEPVEKALNWETLPRSRNSPEDERREGNNREPPQKQEKERNRKEEGKKMHRRRKARDDDDSSDRSDVGELTTVSTDSAFCSEAFPAHNYQHRSQLALQHQQNIRELDMEAEKLLLYFKGHRVLLNYLGIGLTETLWRRMAPLRLCEMEIRPVEDTRQYSDRVDKEPKMVMVQVPNNDGNRQHSSNNKTERVERSLPAQSPRLVALERQLRTDDLNYDWEESSRGYSSDGEGERRDARRLDSRSGRFVKKSAAALIAKKQGFPSQPCLEEPSSSEIVDPRIANEIRALREREEELRRSRTELGLPTLDDVMNRSFIGHHSGLRAARSYDQLHQLVDAHCQNEHFAHNGYGQDRFIHGSQKENQRKMKKSQEVHSHQRSEERPYSER
ncbi:unnamed protein product [Haemonchus placei]|uniref:PINc domain-containing protein n=1 Tax=Haemonchus placei TaxID=6290 RepID=A0A0N4WP64_HAEPC|nr:unnamed protein product [Haemonchus placei]